MRIFSIKTLPFIALFIIFFNANANDKNVLIIGGSSGIGKTLVEKYAESNYMVYTTFNSTIPKIIPNNVNYIKVELLDPESINKISESIKVIKFDVIIYNAGKFGYKSNMGPILDRQD